MKRTVLFVDDEPHVVQGLERGMHNTPYQVLSASSAKEALDILATNRVDAIVADDFLGGASGLQLLSEVKDKYPEMVRIMLTGSSDINPHVGAIANRLMHHYVRKPANMTYLIELLDDAIQLQSIRQK